MRILSLNKLLLPILVDLIASQRCSDQIFTEPEGEIVSHEGYGDGNYDNNLECNFTILTGPQGMWWGDCRNGLIFYSIRKSTTFVAKIHRIFQFRACHQHQLAEHP